jgi:arylsulfatase A-like enzyme
MDRPSAGAGAASFVASANGGPRRSNRQPNIVIVSVDCMRRDRLSAYGYERQTTPFLDSLLPSALHCTSAHSVAPWTCPAVVSLHTGLYPHNHGGGLIPGRLKNLSKDNLPTELPADVPTLPERLAAKGYRTAAMIAVWNANLPMPRRYKVQELIEKPASTLVRRGLRWIGEQDGPFMLWLHLGDAHEPLDVPRPLRNVFGDVPRGKVYRRWAYTKRTDDVRTPEFERYRDARTRLYDASIRSVDASLRDLWKGLSTAGVGDRTVVAVTADHGEELWEHRQEEIDAFADPRGIAGTGHGHNVFQEHLLIPMVISGPDVPAGEVTANTSLVDLHATLADAAGLTVPGDGRSLAGRVDPDRAILAEAIAYGYEKVAVIRGDRKLLHAPDDAYERAFELGRDRTEAGELTDPVAVASLREHVPTGRSAMGEQVESDPEILEHLRELGYIE